MTILTKEYIDAHCGDYRHSFTEFTIPDSFTEIDEGAFEECTSLISITIPDSVTKID